MTTWASPDALRVSAGALTSALAALLIEACFSSPDSQVAKMVCTSDDNCPHGYRCVSPGVVGGCQPLGEPVGDAGGDLPRAVSGEVAGDEYIIGPSAEAGGAGGVPDSPTHDALASMEAESQVPRDDGSVPDTDTGFSSPPPHVPEPGEVASDAGGADGRDSSAAGPDATDSSEAARDIFGVKGDRDEAPEDTAEDGTLDAAPVDCGALPNPTNGFVEASSTTLDATAIYSCRVGFNMMGSASRTCQADGTWSGTAPQCQCPIGKTACSGTCVNLQTDNDNCGICGNACKAAFPSVAEPCANGRCIVTLASGQTQPLALAVDNSYVYWTAVEPDAVVKKIPKSGGPAVPLVSAHVSSPQGMSVDGTYAYWTDYMDGTVSRVALAGGVQTLLATGQGLPDFVVARGSAVYWTNAASKVGTVMKLPLAGNNAVPMALDQDSPQGLAVDGSYVYWVNHGSGEVKRAAISTGASSTLVTGQRLPYDIAVDGSGIYWSNLGTIPLNYVDGAVMRATLTGDSPIAIAPNERYPMCLTVDGEYVYWVRGGVDGTGAVMKAPRSGGARTTIAARQNDPIRIAIDDNSAYWVNLQDGTILKATPK